VAIVESRLFFEDGDQKIYRLRKIVIVLRGEEGLDA
jgi:hypothetical protein